MANRNCCQVTGLIKEVSLPCKWASGAGVRGYVGSFGLLLSLIMDYIRMQEAADGSRCTCLLWSWHGISTQIHSPVVPGPCFQFTSEAPEIPVRLIMGYGWTFSPGRLFDLLCSARSNWEMTT